MINYIIILNSKTDDIIEKIIYNIISSVIDRLIPIPEEETTQPRENSCNEDDKKSADEVKENLKDNSSKNSSEKSEITSSDNDRNNNSESDLDSFYRDLNDLSFASRPSVGSEPSISDSDSSSNSINSNDPI